MTRADPLPTIRAYCNTCKRETEQAQIGRERVCLTCLMNPVSVFTWEKPEAPEIAAY